MLSVTPADVDSASEGETLVPSDCVDVDGRNVGNDDGEPVGGSLERAVGIALGLKLDSAGEPTDVAVTVVVCSSVAPVLSVTPADVDGDSSVSEPVLEATVAPDAAAVLEIDL